MKVFSAIFTALILFLLVQPALINQTFTLADNKQLTNSCCSKEHRTVKSKNRQGRDNNCCNRGHCNNPFLSCSNCYFVSQVNLYSLALQPFVKAQKLRLKDDNILSSYMRDFWHPPEIAWYTQIWKKQFRNSKVNINEENYCKHFCHVIIGKCGCVRS